MRIVNAWRWMVGLALFLAIGPAMSQPVSPVSYVNPFIGTTISNVPTRWGLEGGTYPGAVAPFGFIQLSPETRMSPAKEYDYRDGSIRFFSCLHHRSGYPHGSSGEVFVMPVEASKPFRLGEYNRPFSHTAEKAAPGYYRVRFSDDNTLVEATAAQRAGLFRFTFPVGVTPQLFIGDAGTITEESPKSLRGAKSHTIFTISEDYTGKQAVDGGQLLSFAPSSSGAKVILLSVSASPVGFESTRRNLDKELAGLTFDGLRAKTRQQWADLLSVVQVDDSDQASKTVFYTALYHSLLLPWIVSDVDGRYVGADRQVHQTSGQHQYGGFSPWDTFRTLHPLLCLLFPERQKDMVLSMLDAYRQTGHLPRDPMTGNHAVPIVVDSYRKGISFDSTLAYEAMRKSITEGALPADLAAYQREGYVPFSYPESVTKTVEYAYDDWALGEFARQVMHDPKGAEPLQQRSYSYRNLFNPQTLFMLPRQGRTVNLSPGTSGYKEGDAWIYSYFVPQHPKDLINLMGGEAYFAERLDSALTHRQILFDNETVFHVPYLFNYAGQPAKTQRWVRDIMRSRFGATPGGLPGNDDLGSVSSWYVFSALGLFPMAPGQPGYTLGSPAFRSVTLHLHGGRRLVIRRKNTGPRNDYVRALTVNGKPHIGLGIPHSTLLKGGELIFDMSAQPINHWPTHQPSGEEQTDFRLVHYSVTSKKVEPNEPFWVRFSLQNKGARGTKIMRLLVDGREQARKNCLVATGQTVTDSMLCRLYALGKTTLTLENEPPIKLEVVPAKHPVTTPAVTALTLKPLIRRGQKQVFSFVAQNIGGTRQTFSLPMLLNDSLIRTERLTLAPGETRRVSSEVPIRRDGLQTLRVGGQQALFKAYSANTDATGLDLSPFRYAGDSLVRDRSGLGNHARLIQSSGHHSSADTIRFGETGYLQVPNAPSLDQLGESLTLMTWVYPTSQAKGLVDVFAKGDHHVLQLSGSTLSFFAGGWGRGDCNAELPQNWLNQWHHIAGVCDGTHWRLYIDGRLVKAVDLEGPVNLSTANRWTLGRNEEFPGERIFQGYLDGAKVFVEPLSDTEVSAIVQREKSRF